MGLRPLIAKDEGEESKLGAVEACSGLTTHSFTRYTRIRICIGRRFWGGRNVDFDGCGLREFGMRPGTAELLLRIAFVSLLLLSFVITQMT